MKEIRSILFWGGIWGIVEATLGWGLHLIHFKGEALILYPLGLACMLAAARQCSGSMSSTVLKVAAVAAVIKLVNLFSWPGVPVYYVTNPAVAIFLEGLVTFAFCTWVERKQQRVPHWAVGAPMVLTAFVLVFLSFIAFKGWQVGMDAVTTHNPDAHFWMNTGMLVTWLWKSALQALMLVAAVQLAFHWQPTARWQMQTVRWSLPACVIALLVTFYL